MNNADGDGQFDAGIQQRKEGVLRAKDIIPSLRTTFGQETDFDKTAQNLPRPPAGAETSPETGQRRSEIPRFNLAEEIMAEHRKITAIRRKGPVQIDAAQKAVREAETVGDKKGQMSAELSEQELIIAEIVEKDIKRLSQGVPLRLCNG